MVAHLFRFLGIETFRRVDDAEIDYQLPDIMKITGYGDPFHFLVIPAHFAGDDLAVFADAHGMAVSVTVLDVDGRGKRVHGLFVDRSQSVVQPPILVSLSLKLFQQVMAMNANRDVPGQRADDFQILFAELLPAGFFAQQDKANQAFANYQRHQQLNLHGTEELFMIIEEPLRLPARIVERKGGAPAGQWARMVVRQRQFSLSGLTDATHRN